MSRQTRKAHRSVRRGRTRRGGGIRNLFKRLKGCVGGICRSGATVVPVNEGAVGAPPQINLATLREAEARGKEEYNGVWKGVQGQMANVNAVSSILGRPLGEGRSARSAGRSAARSASARPSSAAGRTPSPGRRKALENARNAFEKVKEGQRKIRARQNAKTRRNANAHEAGLAAMRAKFAELKNTGISKESLRDKSKAAYNTGKFEFLRENPFNSYLA